MKIKSPGPNVAKTIKVKKESIRFYVRVQKMPFVGGTFSVK